MNSFGASTATQVGNTTLTLSFFFSTPATNQTVSSGFERVSVYGYYNWQVLESLLVTAGASYDYLEFPANFRTAPVSAAQDHRDQASPKAGFIWTPAAGTTVRGSYTRSLGGVSYDQSVRLEPSQLSGFNQSYRELIPDAVAGPQSSPFFETWGLGIDRKFTTGTYVGLDAELLHSKVDRMIGAFDMSTTPPFPVTASSTGQELTYYERNLTATINQLVGEQWSLGARYRVSEARLNSAFPQIPSSVSGLNNVDNVATLQQLNLFALFHHGCGFFARAESLWTAQSNRGYAPALPGDDFWQANVFLHSAREPQGGAWTPCRRARPSANCYPASTIYLVCPGSPRRKLARR